MRVSTYDKDKGRAIDPKKDNLVKLPIYLSRYPKLPEEAVNVGYMDSEIKKKLEGKLEGGPLPYKNVLEFKGPDIIHKPEDTLQLTKKLDKSVSGVMVTIDSTGRVSSVVEKITSDIFDPEYKLDWRLFINKPTTTVKYGIKDLAIKNKENKIQANTTVEELFPIGTNSPVPIEYSLKRFEESGIRLSVGSLIIKHENADKKDFLLCNGVTVTSAEEPDLVLALTGDPKAKSVKLEDYEESDFIRFGSNGIKCRTYIKARR